MTETVVIDAILLPSFSYDSILLGTSLRECLKTSKNGEGQANLSDDQIQTNLPDRPE